VNAPSRTSESQRWYQRRMPSDLEKRKGKMDVVLTLVVANKPKKKYKCKQKEKEGKRGYRSRNNATPKA
jgi:hypothetical protein